MTADNAQSFDTKALWNKISRFAAKAGRELVEKALWLHYAAQQPNTPVWAKSVIYGALAYFVLPTDLIPDLLPVTGFTDDLGALAAAVATVSMFINDDVKAKAQQRIQAWFPGRPPEPEVNTEVDA